MAKDNSKKSVVELLDGEIKRLREAGYTFQQIAEKGGVTRGRIEQVIKKYYPGTEPRTLNEKEAAKLLGIPYDTLLRLRRNGLVHPVKLGRFYRYDGKTLEEVRKAMIKPCRICGNPVPPGKKSLCAKCSAMIKDPKLRMSLPGERERHHVFLKNYRMTHREQVNLGHHKSSLNYHGKIAEINYELSLYQVRVSHPKFGIGEQFKAIGFVNKQLLLADGRMIPVVKIIKVSGPRGRLSLKKLETFTASENDRKLADLGTGNN